MNIKCAKIILAKQNVKEGSSEEARCLYKDILERFPKNKKARQGLAALDSSQQPDIEQAPPQETINQLGKSFDKRKQKD